MAAYTIGYQPQFVQSDVGAIQKQFADMQQQYDLGYQSQLGAEDTFANIPVVSASDAQLRDEVLGGFRTKAQAILDEYGGDYGAASKRLAREIVSTRANPFFNLAARKAQLAEEQRKMAAQPGSIILKNVADVNLRDAQGNYISPDQLGYQVTTRDILRNELSNAYGKLADKISTGDFESVKGVPYLIQRAITRGITEQEVPLVAKQMEGTLKQMYPTLDDNIAESISMEQANQLVKGTQFDTAANEQWRRNQEAAEWGRRNPRYTGDDTGGGQSPYTMRYGQTNIDDKIATIDESFNNYKQIASVYYNKDADPGKLAGNITDVRNRYVRTAHKAPSDPGALANFIQYNKTGEAGKVASDMLNMYATVYGKENLQTDNTGAIIGIKKGKVTEVANRTSELLTGDERAFTKKRHQQALNEAVGADGMPMYNELIKQGVGPITAVNQVVQARKEKMALNSGYYKPTDSQVYSSIVEDFKVNPSEIKGAYDIKTGKKVDDSTVRRLLNSGKNITPEINLIDKTVAFTVDDGDTQRHIEVPINNIGNEAVRKGLTMYNSFLNDIHSLSANNNSSFVAPGGNSEFIFESKYNPATKKMDRTLVYIQKTGEGEAEAYSFSTANGTYEQGLSLFAKQGASAIIDSYGKQPQYKTRTR